MKGERGGKIQHSKSDTNKLTLKKEEMQCSKNSFNKTFTIREFQCLFQGYIYLIYHIYRIYL